MKSIYQEVNNLGPATRQAGDNNACTVYSFAACFRVPYDIAYEYAAKKWKRIKGRGVTTRNIMSTFGTTPQTAKEVFGKLVQMVEATQGYKQPSGAVIERQMTLSTFCKNYPTGTYYVLVDRHALAIIDGEVIDHTDKPKRRIKQAWQIV